MSSRNFVIERTRFDTGSIDNITYIFDGTVRRPSIFKPENYSEAVLSRLDELGFDPEKDSIVIVGPIVNNCLFMLSLASVYPVLTLQIYDASKCCYTSVTWRHNGQWGASLLKELK